MALYVIVKAPPHLCMENIARGDVSRGYEPKASAVWLVLYLPRDVHLSAVLFVHTSKAVL